MSDVRDDLTQVLALLVDEPREVVVTEADGDRGPQLEAQVAEGDLGKVIGRQGRTARALRCVLGARAESGEQPLELKILDD
jgi:predicted RNA-binding protein YlqC (UPF0109 family)